MELGVVVEGCPQGKSLALVEGLRLGDMPEFRQRLRGTLQGSEPRVVWDIVTLGVAEAPHIPDFKAVLRQFGTRGASLPRGFATRAAGMRWPLAARVFYRRRAKQTVDYPPLAVGRPQAAFRLNALQANWAHAAIMGQRQGRRPALSSEARQSFLTDMGRRPLWDEAVAQSIAPPAGPAWVGW